MLDDVFAEAIVHRPAAFWARIRGFSGHIILGLRVRPFSFWHAFNLDLVGYTASPREITSVSRGKNLTQFSALLLAVRCCRLRYPKTLASPSIVETLLYQVASLRFARAKFPSEQAKKFLDYRADYADCIPELPDAGESVKLPWYLYHVAMLRRLRPELTEAQAWDFPIAEAQWRILASLAAQGAKIDILTPEDRRDIEAMEAEARAARDKIVPISKGA